MEVVVERIDPQDDVAAPRRRPIPMATGFDRRNTELRGAPPEADRGEARQRPLRRDLQRSPYQL